MRCTNPACNREHFFQVRYCPYCGAPQPATQTEPSRPSEVEIPPPSAAPGVEPITQQAKPARTDDKRLDDELWEKACALGTIREIEQYLHTNTPFKKNHIKEAEQLFETLDKQDRDRDESLWNQASTENSVEAYRRYLTEDLCRKRHADEAQKKIEGLERKAVVSKPAPVIAKPVPSPSAPSTPWTSNKPEGPTKKTDIQEPEPVAAKIKWWKFALVGVAIILGYVIWAKQGEDKTPADTSQQAQIADLLRLASIDISGDRLTSPPGNNALEKYQHVLSLRPEHPEALQGIKNIAAGYMKLYKTALSRGDTIKARTYLDRAASVDPEIASNRGKFESELAANDSGMSRPSVLSAPVEAPPPIIAGPSTRQQDESRCKDLVEAGWRSLNQRPNSDFEQAISLVQQAQSIMPDCPGASALQKQALSQRDFFVAERLRKEREDSVNRDRCQAQINQGRLALQLGRQEQALRYVAGARAAYAQCPGADALEQEANAALASASQQADTEKLTKCETLVRVGNDAFLRRDYSAALRNAAQAKRTLAGCPGADDLQNRANEAVCTRYVADGQEAMRAGRYSQAVNSARRAISTFARCTGAESLEQEASLAMNAAKGMADQEKQEKARVRCEALMDAARDALLSKSYDQAINSAKRARQAYAQCTGADAIEREAVEAKRKARENTAIF